jgi:transposase
LGKSGGAGPSVRGAASRADHRPQGGDRVARQHFGESASRWNWRIKKNGPQAIGRSRGGLTTKIHLVAGDERTALCFSLSAGHCADGPEGRKLLEGWGTQKPSGITAMIMDRAYEGDETRQLVLRLEMTPVVPPKITRLNPWEYDRELYKKRNEVERLFRRLKGFRRIFSRFDKLDQMFTAFIHVALIFDALIYLNTP